MNPVSRLIVYLAATAGALALITVLDVTGSNIDEVFAHILGLRTSAAVWLDAVR